MKYRYATTPTFRKALAGLNPSQKQSAKKVFAIFKVDPFDPRLKTHKVHGLSARLGRTIYCVRVEADLRALFYLEKDLVVSVGIGDHRIYRD